MSRYEVSANGTVFGVYEADTLEGALDLCAQDAGYKDVSDMESQLGQPSELEGALLDEELADEPSYSVRYAHSDSDVPGTLTMSAKTDAAFVEKLKAFVEEGFRNGTWANAELKSGAAVGYRNEHGKAVGGVRT